MHSRHAGLSAMALLAVAAVLVLAGFSGAARAAGSEGLSAPVLATAPRLDQIVTSPQPLLSWANSEGVSDRTYTLELDSTATFDSTDLRRYGNIPEDVHITSFHLPDALQDGRTYFWRVRADDGAGGSGPWGAEIGNITARFHVDTHWDAGYFGVRVPALSITASSGTGTEHIQSYAEDGLSGWRATPGEQSYWVQFDLDKPTAISRIWMLFKEPGWKPRDPAVHRDPTAHAFVTRVTDLSGRPTSYEWQFSEDGTTWQQMPGTKVDDADAYRRYVLLDSAPIAARHFRLVISKWLGDAPQLNEVTFYRAGPAPPIEAPNRDYVIVVGNGRSDDGNRNTPFRDVILGLNGHIKGAWDLDVMEIPAYNISLDAVRKLKRRPVAIFLTGFGRWQEMLPEFEFNGLYEIIRATDVPLFGACGGHQLMAQQADFTFARDTGRLYVSGTEQPAATALASVLEGDVPPIKVVTGDPIFAGLVNPFYGPQAHSWKVAKVPDDFEVLATSVDSRGLEVVEVMRAKGRLVYGTQFHPEVAQAHSASKLVLVNFIHLALDDARSVK